MFDWFTFIAQIVNFLILVWLLKRFLYAPLTKAMDEREAEIRTRLTSASEAKKMAQESRLLLEKQVEEIERTKVAKLEEMEKEVSDTRKQLLAKIRSEVEELEERYRESLEREKSRLLSQFKMQMYQEILEIARRIMRDLADRDLETQIVRKFLNQASESHSLTIRSVKPSLLVKTCFGMESQAKEEIRDFLNSILQRPYDLTFETSGKSIAGIEVIIDGHKASWTINDYLNTLDKRIIGAATNEIS